VIVGEMPSRHVPPLFFDLPSNNGVQATEAVCLEREIVPLHTNRHDDILYNVAHFHQSTRLCKQHVLEKISVLKLYQEERDSLFSVPFLSSSLPE